MRVRTILVLGLLAALAAGHTALWLWATGQLRTGLDLWADQQRAAGWTVAHGGAARGGWPLAATLTVAAPAVAAPLGLSWTGEQVVLRVALDRPSVLTIAPRGAQTLRLGRLPQVAATAGAFTIDVPLAAAGAAELLVRGLRASAGGEDATAGLLTGRVDPGGAETTFTLSAEAVALPDDGRWALGPHVSSATVEGGLAGPLDAPDPRAWRDGGGALDIRHFALGWGPLGAFGSGRLGLDRNLQPEGTARVGLVGAGAALDAAAAAGAVSARAATAVKAVLALLQGASDSGGRVDVPVALRDGTLSAAGIPLARVPPLSLDDAPARP